MSHPSTPKEAKALGVLRYFTGAPCKRGHVATRFASTAQCSECQKFHHRNAYDANPEKYRAEAIEWHALNRNRALERMTLYRQENPEIIKEATRAWQAANPEKMKAYKQKRARAEKLATPWWLSSSDLQKMIEMYQTAKVRTQSTGVAHHVDHIVPLQGADVCGLNVPWNLQVIEAFENMRKGARFSEEIAA